MLEKSGKKIILVGAVGSGKTTSISTVSDISVVSTESKATESKALHRKKTTTIAMDYGHLQFEGQKLHLYGAPGQRRFDFMVPVLSAGTSGMLVLIDNGAENPLQDVDYYLNTHKSFLMKKPAVIVITHYDDNCTDTTLLDYHCYVIERGFSIPVITIDAREKDQVLKALRRLNGAIEEMGEKGAINAESAAVAFA